MVANYDYHRFNVGDRVRANMFGCGNCAFCRLPELVVTQVLSPIKVRCSDPTGFLNHPDYRDFDTYRLDLIACGNINGQGGW